MLGLTHYGSDFSRQLKPPEPYMSGTFDTVGKQAG